MKKQYEKYIAKSFVSDDEGAFGHGRTKQRAMARLISAGGALPAAAIVKIYRFFGTTPFCQPSREPLDHEADAAITNAGRIVWLRCRMEVVLCYRKS